MCPFADMKSLMLLLQAITQIKKWEIWSKYAATTKYNTSIMKNNVAVFMRKFECTQNQYMDDDESSNNSKTDLV